MAERRQHAFFPNALDAQPQGNFLVTQDQPVRKASNAAVEAVKDAWKGWEQTAPVIKEYYQTRLKEYRENRLQRFQDEEDRKLRIAANVHIRYHATPDDFTRLENGRVGLREMDEQELSPDRRLARQLLRETDPHSLAHHLRIVRAEESAAKQAEQEKAHRAMREAEEEEFGAMAPPARSRSRGRTDGWVRAGLPVNGFVPGLEPDLPDVADEVVDAVDLHAEPEPASTPEPEPANTGAFVVRRPQSSGHTSRRADSRVYLGETHADDVGHQDTSQGRE